jgi:proline dehydrogenase
MRGLRKLFLPGSQSRWVRERATRYAFVRRSVSRFIPGERLEDALEAARTLQEQGAGAILTQLGENVADAAEAEQVTRHYLEVLDQVAAASLDAQISVKLTQLGLDLDPQRCLANLTALVERAERGSSFVWIDMEGSDYVDATLDLFRRARASSARVGVWITDTVAIRHILDHLGLSPPEEPPPDVREVVRVPVDDQGQEIGASPA